MKDLDREPDAASEVYAIAFLQLGMAFVCIVAGAALLFFGELENVGHLAGILLVMGGASLALGMSEKRWKV